MASAGVPRSMDEAVARYVRLLRHVGAPQMPGSEAAWRAYAREAWERSGGKFDGSGIARQIGAIQKSGDRTAELKRIQAPTLVVHGDVDLLVDPSGGRATAETIPGARLVTIEGMRHDIDPIRAPAVAALIFVKYFTDRNIPGMAASANWAGVRRAVNGGLNGWDDFRAAVEALIAIARFRGMF